LSRVHWGRIRPVTMPNRVIRVSMRAMEGARAVGAREEFRTLGAALLILLVLALTACLYYQFSPRASAILILALLAVVLAVVLAVTRWHWLVIIAAFSIPYPWATQAFPVIGRTMVGVWDLCLLTAFAGWLLRSGVQRATVQLRGPGFDAASVGAMGLMVVVGLATAAARGELGVTRLAVRPIEMLIWWHLALQAARTEGAVRGLLASVALSGLAQSFMACAQHFGWMGMFGQYEPQPRAYVYWLTRMGTPTVMPSSGTLSHFTALGHYANQCWPSAVALALAATRPRARRLWWLVAAVVFVGMTLSYSRGSLGAGFLLVALLLYFLPKGNAAAWCRTGSAIVLMLMVLAILLAVSSPYRETLNYGIRMQIWQKALEGWPADTWQAIFGRGWGGTEVTVFARGAHNSYVKVLVDAGVLGLVFFVTFMGALLRLLPGALVGDEMNEARACRIVGASGALIFAVESVAGAYFTGDGYSTIQLFLLGAIGVAAVGIAPRAEGRPSAAGMLTSAARVGGSGPLRPARARPPAG